MRQVRDVHDAFELALTLEQRGLAFYTAAYETTADPAVRKVFSRLAAYEAEHAALFVRLRAALPATSAPPTADPGARRVTIAALRHLFADEPDVPGLVARCTTPQATLDLALEFEKDAVVLYSSMLEWVPPECGRDQLHQLVDQELSHVILLHEAAMMLGPDGELPP
jgi:rubrerythrin